MRKDRGITMTLVTKELLDTSIDHLLNSSTNRERDLSIASKLQSLYYDGIDDRHGISSDALITLVSAFVKYQYISKPTTIALTPDNTIMVRWQGAPEGFVRTSIEFPSGKATTICHGVRAEWNFYNEG